MMVPHIVPCGDRTALVYLGAGIDPDLSDRVQAMAAALRAKAHPAITEVSPAYESVLVEYDPLRIAWPTLCRLIQTAHGQPGDHRPGRTVDVPVCYGDEWGPDLATVAAYTGLTAAEVVRRHSEPAYRVYCLGFSPGFLYLGGLDPALHLPRREVPRTRVPVGSVAIGGAQTGAYPRPSPGGWHIVGQTPIRLFDAQRQPPAVAEPGDRIRFVPVDPDEYARLAATQTPLERVVPTWTAGRTGLHIRQPGLCTTVQDLGRRGYQAYGVPTAGAADYWPLIVGNWLLANRARTGALEITLTGPEVEFAGPVAFCLTGAPVPAVLTPADGGSPRSVPGWQVLLAGPGDRLTIGTTTAGARAYLCVAGGLDLPATLDSVSEDLLAGIGPFGRKLQAGDWLPTGLPLLPPADLAGRALPAAAIPTYPSDLTVRVTLGPQADAFGADAVAAFLGGTYTVTAQADRQGMRLSGPVLRHQGSADILSEGMPVGAIQVPAGGQPILALANRGTTGGYAKIAVAIYPDVARAAQLRPGDRLRFQAVDLAEAHRIAWAERRRLAQVRRYLRQAGAVGVSVAAASVPAAAVAGPDRVTVPAVVAPPGLSPQGPRRLAVRVAGQEFLVEIEEILP